MFDLDVSLKKKIDSDFVIILNDVKLYSNQYMLGLFDLVSFGPLFRSLSGMASTQFCKHPQI